MCKAKNCNNKPVKSGKGFCRKHYDQYRKLGYVTELKSIYDRNEIDILDDYAIIKIRNRNNETIAEGLVDIEDVDKVKDIKWRLHNNGYIQGTSNGKRVGYIHRYILDYKGKKEIDHINRNKLDNRKINLRICEHNINARNKDIKNKYGAHGIIKLKRNLSKPYLVQIDGKYIGYYSTPEEATKARKEAEKKYR